MEARGGRPRTSRSRLVATKSCSAAVSEYQSVGRTIPGRPSACRPLAMAWRAALVHTEELS